MKNEIEIFIINKVKETRKIKGLTQQELSLKLNKSIGFIGDVESRAKRVKYNVCHLNDLAKIFNCSPKDFWPNDAL